MFIRVAVTLVSEHWYDLLTETILLVKITDRFK